jgi:hypothetical protein
MNSELVQLPKSLEENLEMSCVFGSPRTRPFRVSYIGISSTQIYLILAIVDDSE